MQIRLSSKLLVASIAFCAVSAATLFDENQSRANSVTRSSDAFESTTTADYSKFSHNMPREHADLMGRSNCGSCHRRKTNSLEPSFPSHRDCTGCHLVQFTAASSGAAINPICTICHKEEGLTSPNAPLKSFPGLRSFSAAFDHAQHLKGIDSARPMAGCATCHGPANRGVAESIPQHLSAHQICYDCHSSGKQADKFSSCGSCHSLGSYSRSSTAARAYRVGFSHAEHSARKRLNCDSCHSILARGTSRGRQVSSTSPALHRALTRSRSCLTCHDGQRAFGDKGPKFEDCKRCHKGVTFGT